MSTVTAIRRSWDVDTSEEHVRSAHEHYSGLAPDLCGRLVEDETQCDDLSCDGRSSDLPGCRKHPGTVSFLLFVPELGQVLTYRASLFGEAS